MGSISRLIIKIDDGVISRRYEGIFDIHFRVGDTADFVSPYITMGNSQ